MKYKGQIEFDNIGYLLNVNSREKIEQKRAVLQDIEVPIIHFTDADEFYGKPSDQIHIDSISMSLARRFGYNFESSLAQNANIMIQYRKLTASEDFKCQIKGTSVLLNGTLKFVVTVKDVIVKDLRNSNSLVFSGVNIRTGKEILSFTKYGENWELEKEERDRFANSGDTSYLSGRPNIVSR